MPFEVWIAYRLDGIKGSGTLHDPFDGSTAAKLDEVLNSLPAKSRVHLGECPVEDGNQHPFITHGYSELSGGWQIKPGMVISGAGMSTTTLKIENLQSGSSQTHAFAIGHDLSMETGSPPEDVPNPVDMAEISDLTIDCNLDGQSGSAIACGAIRLMGNHVRIHRVKAIHWGTNNTSVPGHVLSVVTGDRASGLFEAENAGIENCICTDPATADLGPTTVLHAGGVSSAAATAEAQGKSPYIRNCYVDCGNGFSETAWPERVGISMGWCQGGIIESNHIHNTRIAGPYQEYQSACDIIARNNYFRNVFKGPCWNVGQLHPSTPISLASLACDTTDHTIAVATSNGAHNLLEGERVKISATPAPYAGIFAIIAVPQADVFHYRMASDPGGNAASGSTMQKAIGIGRLIIERNRMEMAEITDAEPIAIAIDVESDAGQGNYPHGEVHIRQNVITFKEGQAANGAVGIRFGGDGRQGGVENSIIADNIIENASAHALKNSYCGSVEYFNNKTPSGALIQGYDEVQQKLYNELESDMDDALLLALI